MLEARLDGVTSFTGPPIEAVMRSSHLTTAGGEVCAVAPGRTHFHEPRGLYRLTW